MYPTRAHTEGRSSLVRATTVDSTVPECVAPFTVGGLVVVKPKSNPADLVVVLQDGTDTAGMEVGRMLAAGVSEPVKLKPTDVEPKPLNPMNAEVCTIHKTTLQCGNSNMPYFHK